MRSRSRPASTLRWSRCRARGCPGGISSLTSSVCSGMCRQHLISSRRITPGRRPASRPSARRGRRSGWSPATACHRVRRSRRADRVRDRVSANPSQARLSPACDFSRISVFWPDSSGIFSALWLDRDRRVLAVAAVKHTGDMAQACAGPFFPNACEPALQCASINFPLEGLGSAPGPVPTQTTRTRGLLVNRPIACPSSRAFDSATILHDARRRRGIVLVTIETVDRLFDLSIAVPDSTPCPRAIARAVRRSANRALRDRAGRVDDVVLQGRSGLDARSRSSPAVRRRCGACR